MSEARNIKAESAARAAELHPAPWSPETRARVVAEIAELAGSESFCMREGALRIDVPLGIALAHVDGSLLIRVIAAVREHARILLRAAATGSGEVLGNWFDHCPYDEPGDFVELLDNGGICFVSRDFTSDYRVDDVFRQEHPSAGVMGENAASELFNDGVGAVPHHGLLHGEASPVHPDPLSPVMRRAAPPS